jgi:hypothetical protein
MARVLGLMFSVCLLTTVAGCGGSTHVTTNVAQADCDDFVENFLCPTLQYCGASYSSVGSCIAFFEGSASASDPLYCDTVTVEYTGLASCEAEVNDSYCAELVDAAGYATLPPACLGVFN